MRRHEWEIDALASRVRELESLAHRHTESAPYRTLNEWQTWAGRQNVMAVVDRWELEQLKGLLNSRFSFTSHWFLKEDAVLLQGVCVVARGSVVQ